MSRSGADLSRSFARVLAPGDALRWWGHSYVFGITPAGDPAKETMAYMSADMLGMPCRNEGVSGSTLGVPASGASWSTFLQRVTRPARRFSQPGGMHALMYGINDLQHFGNTTAAMLPFQ